MNRCVVILPLLASACLGDITGIGDDPSPTNDPQDEPPPPPTEVRIAVHDPSGPVSGLAAIFMNADDSVAADITTDAQGVAIAKLPLGGSITVIRDTSSATEPGGLVYTYVGVKAGDKLDLALPAIPTNNPTTVTVHLPYVDPNDPPQLVEVKTPCGFGQGIAPDVTVTLDGSCGAMTDFYVSEIGGEYPAAFLKRAAIAPIVDLSTEMYRPALSTSLSVTNTPIGATVSIEKTLETDLFRPVVSTGAITLAPDQSTDIDIPDLPGVEEELVATVSYQGSTQRVGKRQPYAAAPGMVDLSTAMIISPSAPTLAGNMLTWTEAGSGVPDLVVAMVDGSVHRMIVAPYAGASLRIPRLPATHDAFNPQSTDTASVELAKVTGGYNNVRKSVFSGPLAPLNGSATLSLSASP